MSSYEKYGKKYYEKNKEKWKEYRKQHYEENKEQIRAKAREYWQENKEELYKKQREYQKKNNKRFSELCQNSRRRRVERLRSEGVTNAWAVVTRGETPKYKQD